MSINSLLKKYKSIILYLICGVLTTLVNIVTYYLGFNVLKIRNIPSTVIAWILSVMFAFITNKRYVFESKVSNVKGKLQEMISFYGCRLITGGMDVLIMFIAVDCFHMNSMIWKIISNIIVVIINYIVSKLIIFKR